MGLQLGRQAGIDVGIGVLLTRVLSRIAGGTGQCVCAVVATGLLVSPATHVPDWNWCRYRGDWLMGQLIEAVIGLLLSGGVAAW